MIRRREFITLLGGAAAWPLAARAQQGDRVRRIGVLMPYDENEPFVKPYLPAFIQALAGLGWTEGRNVRIDLRWAGGDTDRIRVLAQELVGQQPDIILTGGAAATAALQRETRTIPIVFAGVTDPVATSIVPRFNQPGGNVTGFAFLEASLGGKWLELLSEIAPGLKRAAIMFNPDLPPPSAYVPSFETAARSLKVEPIIAPVHSDVEIETAITALGREPGGGLVVIPDIFMTPHRAPIILAAATLASAHWRFSSRGGIAGLKTAKALGIAVPRPWSSSPTMSSNRVRSWRFIAHIANAAAGERLAQFSADAGVIADNLINIGRAIQNEGEP
jgi:putative ABC transport system substrate-binding protein